MPIRFRCPSCNAKLKSPDEGAGKTIKCPICEHRVAIPEPIYDAEVVAPAGEPAAEMPEILDDDEFGGDDPYGLADEPAAPLPGRVGGAGSPAGGEDDNLRPCPMCGEMIQAVAVKCRFCGEVFDKDLKKAKKKKKKSRARSHSADDDDLTGAEIALAILCSNIACIAGVIWMIQGKSKGLKIIMVAIAANVGWFIIGMIIGFVRDQGGGPGVGP